MNVRCDSPETEFDMRFVDTDTEDPNDHPWRMIYKIDNTIVDWDGTWQTVSVKLSDFIDIGAWEDDTWYDPQGDFDWTKIDRFEIATEYHSLENISLEFDQIRIEGTYVPAIENSQKNIDQKLTEKNKKKT